MLQVWLKKLKDTILLAFLLDLLDVKMYSNLIRLALTLTQHFVRNIFMSEVSVNDFAFVTTRQIPVHLDKSNLRFEACSPSFLPLVALLYLTEISLIELMFW